MLGRETIGITAWGLVVEGLGVASILTWVMGWQEPDGRGSRGGNDIRDGCNAGRQWRLWGSGSRQVVDGPGRVMATLTVHRVMSVR